MDKNNELVAVIEQSGLDTTKSDTLLKSFIGCYQKARQVVEESRGIQVTDESQKDEMAKAHELRMVLRDIRTKEIEPTRVKLKEQNLRENKAIDGISNILKALIVPAEEYLEKQERFAELKEAERKARVYGERVEKLSRYVSDVTLYNIRDMADEVFENLLAGCKASWEKAKDDEEKAKLEREEELRKDKLEISRKMELAPYIQFTRELSVDLRTLPEKEYKTILTTAKHQMMEYEAKQEETRKENEKLRKEAEENEKALAKERAEQAEKLRKLSAEKEKAEAKLRAEKEAQAKKEAEDKVAADAKVRVEEEAKRQALLAPDKEKLLNLAHTLQMLPFPAVESYKARGILEQTEQKLSIIINFIQEGAKKL